MHKPILASNAPSPCPLQVIAIDLIRTGSISRSLASSSASLTSELPK